MLEFSRMHADLMLFDGYGFTANQEFFTCRVKVPVLNLHVLWLWKAALRHAATVCLVNRARGLRE